MDKRVGVFVVVLIALVGMGCTGSDEPSTVDGTPVVEKGNLSVHFLSVGHGDSTLVVFSDRCMLIDGGDPEMGPVISSYMRDQGITKVDLMVATHTHPNHVGGLITVLNDFEVGEVYYCGVDDDSEVYQKFLSIVDEQNIPRNVVKSGQKIDLDPNLEIEVLSPSGSSYEKMNDNSVVLKITYGQASFLFMGDAQNYAENDLISSGYDLDCDVLKVGHHGSTTSTTPDFVSEVTPIISVIEVGDNSYGHPDPKILGRLESVGSDVYRTDVNGNVIITTDGVEYDILAQK